MNTITLQDLPHWALVAFPVIEYYNLPEEYKPYVLEVLEIHAFDNHKIHHLCSPEYNAELWHIKDVPVFHNLPEDWHEGTQILDEIDDWFNGVSNEPVSYALYDALYRLPWYAFGFISPEDEEDIEDIEDVIDSWYEGQSNGDNGFSEYVRHLGGC